MSRPYWLLIWLAGIIALGGLTYASLPMVLAGLVKQTLAARGLSDVQVSVGYPDWRGIRLHTLQFTTIAGELQISCQLTDVDVEYHVTGLMAGTIARIQVPVTAAQVQPRPGITPSPQTPTTLPLAALVSGHWLSQLPVRELLLEQLTVDWRTPSDAIYTAQLTGTLRDGEAQVNGEVNLPAPQRNQARFSLSARQTGAARLSLSPADHTAEPMFNLAINTVAIQQDQIEVEGMLQAKFDTLVPLLEPWLAMADWAPGLKGYFKSQWQAVLPVDAPAPLADILTNISLHSENTLEVQATRVGPLTNVTRLQLKIDTILKAGTIHWQIAKDARFSTALAASSSTTRVKKDQPVVVTVPQAMSGQVRFVDEEVNLTVQPGSRLAVHPYTFGDLALPEIQLAFSDMASLHYRWTTQRWQGDPMTLSLAAASLQGGQYHVHYDDLSLTLEQLHGEGSNWQVEGAAKVRGLSGRWREQSLPRAELSARFKSDQQQMTVQTTLRAAEHAVVLEANGMHYFTTGKGHADLNLEPVVFTKSGLVLSQLLDPWPYPFDVTTGRLSGTGRLAWQPSGPARAAQLKSLNQRFFLQLENIGGRYKELAFIGLNGKVPLANGECFRTTKEAQLNLELLDVGFPIENIDVRFQLAPHPRTRQYIVQIEKFAADLLGGKARSEPFYLDFGREKNQFMMQLEGISLNDIMQLEQQEGLQGSGKLDGQVPIEITHAGIEVKQGQLSTRAPGGNIRYVPTEKVLLLAQRNESVKMVVDALSNFQYHVLDVTSDYQPDGDLILQVRLKGHNPDWQAGQPIHLNLNLEENIPMLLRSLQLSDEITERVRKRYQNAQ